MVQAWSSPWGHQLVQGHRVHLLGQVGRHPSSNFHHLTIIHVLQSNERITAAHDVSQAGACGTAEHRGGEEEVRAHLHVGFVVCTDSDCILQRLWGLELVLAVQSGAHCAAQALVEHTSTAAAAAIHFSPIYSCSISPSQYIRIHTIRSSRLSS